MCDICKKQQFVVETLEMILDDEMMREHLKVMKPDIEKTFGAAFTQMSEKDQIEGARLSLIALGMVELAHKYNLSRNDVYAMIQYGIRWVALKVWLKDQDALGEHHVDPGMMS